MTPFWSQDYHLKYQHRNTCRQNIFTEPSLFAKRPCPRPPPESMCINTITLKVDTDSSININISLTKETGQKGQHIPHKYKSYLLLQSGVYCINESCARWCNSLNMLHYWHIIVPKKETLKMLNDIHSTKSI